MNSNLKSLIQSKHVDNFNSTWHTHVSMIPPLGKFAFDRIDLDSLWDMYCQTVNGFTDSTTPIIIGLAEKPQLYSAVLVDVDLKINESDVNDTSVYTRQHIYSEEQLRQVVRIYQNVIESIVDNCTPQLLTCVVLEKPMHFITTGNTRFVKNGFHLHFPFLFMSTIDQSVHLIPRVKNEMKSQNVFSSIGVEDSSIVIDKAVCSVPWLMYGSRKSEDSQPYLITHILDSTGEIVSLEDCFQDYKIYDADEQPVNMTTKGVAFYIPRILSILPYGRATSDIKVGIEEHSRVMLQTSRNFNRSNSKKNTMDVSTIQENLKESSFLLSLLSSSRADDRNDWMTIGWVLYSISDGNDEGMEQWLEFSAQSDKYDETKCLFEWDHMTKKDKTIGTLKFFAKLDNPEKYLNYVKKNMKSLIHKSFEGAHNDIAKLLHSYFGDEFKCSSIDTCSWYQYRPEQHKWQQIEQGIFLREKISGVLVNEYVEIAKELVTEYGNCTDKAQEAAITTKRKLLDVAIKNLKSAPFKNNVMKECSEVFYDPTFALKLDQNPMLIAFKNGVYDLKLNIFRQGLIDDYISKTLPIDFKEFHEVDNEVQNIKEFLLKVFPDKSVRNYFLCVYSDIFVGGNSLKKVYMWTGEGDNAKSVTQKLFELMLGELAIKFNTQYFTGKKTATGCANPELSRAGPPVRHVTMEEPDCDEQLNIGELKKLSGGDSYWARDLFEKGKQTREVFPMFTLTFICNKLPKLKYSDKATWNRIRVIPFESTFVQPGEPCPTTFEEQLIEKRFPMDRNFNSKLPGMIQAFAWYLLKWRQTVTTFDEPVKVKEATDMYRQQNDIYRQFIEENYIIDSSGDVKAITSIEVYSTFKEWYKETFPSVGVPFKNEVIEHMENLWGKMEKNRWKVGFRRRELDDDIETGDAVYLD